MIICAALPLAEIGVHTHLAVRDLQRIRLRTMDRLKQLLADAQVIRGEVSNQVRSL